MLTSSALSAILFAGSAVAASHKFGQRDLLITDGVKAACEQLSAYASNSTLLPNSTAYETQRINVWDKRANLHPACIYMPSSADDVAKAVEIFYANKAPFAVKGGGHMNYPGSNTIDDGILLALNNVNTINVHADENTIEVGPGNKWVDVYTALHPYGQYVVGGRMKTIGVPGLTLIGGVNYFLNKYGFTMDNVLRYDVVLGNGTQVTASNTSNPDLFWALKGGSSNYGIVTNFVFRTLNIPKFSTTLQTFPGSSIPAFITAACDMVLSDDGSVAAGGVANLNYNVTTKEADAMIFGAQETLENPPSRFANYTAIPNATSQVHNITEPLYFHAQMESPNQMFRISFGHYTMKPDAKRLIEIYEAWISAIQDISDVEGLRPTFIINTLSPSAALVGKNNGIGNTFGLEGDQPWIFWQLTTSWARAEDDLRMTAWTQGFLERHHAINKAQGLASEFIYMGDAAEFQKPFPQFGAENYQRMREIRNQYDPDLVFTKLNWGGFKLGY
ncbi:Bifunctional solanapyrone synthase [Colletotrichum orbiculare MAFF 240422]|uniref:Bifunctional solanapyrone synthase n=1 Tax=Colletotrichum orbiculare (strain 104-T / ATCC 96160 / CBS 514.97 / LARS 414 / MAFF 240422) TaxID=1213857 RepID=N4V928_COLOR|nr:Bifunctional solanapyrone synthase [Colletotrichum orbiculare MAFF 240422]